jgi:hypothetical protein
VIQVYTCITGNNTIGFVVRIDEQNWSTGRRIRCRWNRFAYSRIAMLEKIRTSWDQLVGHIGEHAASEVFERVDSISDSFTSIQRLEYHFVNGKVRPVWVVS